MTSQAAVVSRRNFLCLVAVAVAFCPVILRADDDKPPDLLIGYTEFRTDLPGGRYVNIATRRAVVAKADGTGRRVMPGDPTTIRFSVMINGKTRAYLVDRDGKNKRELSKDYPHLVHGMSLSPDGKRGAYEDPAYRLFLADADSSNAREVKTGE